MMKTKPIRLSGAKLTERNERIDQREQRKCARCGMAIWNNASRHHRKFRSRRGGDEVSNGLLLCGSGTTDCHGWVHAHPVQARVSGFAVHTWENPRLVPVQHIMHGLVYLDDEGGFSTTPPRDLGELA